MAVQASTCRTLIRAARTAHRFPPMAAFLADEVAGPLPDLIVAAFQQDGLTMNQRLGYHMPGTLHNPSESRPGHPHFLPCFFVGQAFQIGQTNSFHLR